MPTGISNDGLNMRLSNDFNKVNKRLLKNINKLSTGAGIIQASDNPAGLAVAGSLESSATGLRNTLENLHGASSMMSVAEGGLSQISGILTRAKDLAMQSINGTVDRNSRSAMNSEFQGLKNEINRLAGATEFRGHKLLNGDLAQNSSNQVNISVGSPDNPSNQININVIEGSNASQLGLQNTDILTRENAQKALGALDQASNQVQANRSNIGALTSRFAQAASHMGITIENLTSAASGIQAVDYAAETSAFSRNQVQQQASISSLAQSRMNMAGQLLNIKI